MRLDGQDKMDKEEKMEATGRDGAAVAMGGGGRQWSEAFSLETGLGPISLISQMDADIPSLSSGSVGSRFVSQTELDAAKQRREEQWKAAYAR